MFAARAVCFLLLFSSFLFYFNGPLGDLLQDHDVPDRFLPNFYDCGRHLGADERLFSPMTYGNHHSVWVDLATILNSRLHSQNYAATIKPSVEVALITVTTFSPTAVNFDLDL